MYLGSKPELVLKYSTAQLALVKVSWHPCRPPAEPRQGRRLRILRPDAELLGRRWQLVLRPRTWPT